ncbi:response regulator transcription factor [Nannocystis pusilla]|uniref:Response regulator transcription factor n=1 Tax=Nannocystis pusilla TaxID=889268 RepID=A0A9X3J0R5_9BACT|nr:response regulator transcription factor [Nannocystis pusilla]MCY1009328.1 response regulator transcription factor [Nannocystis pusilla]
MPRSRRNRDEFSRRRGDRTVAHTALRARRGLPPDQALGPRARRPSRQSTAPWTGLALLPTLRARGIDIPVIVLTARGELEDRLAGLNQGADDYLAKPFAVEEVLARLRAVLRRPGRLAADTVRVGRLRFDLLHREASIDDAPLLLPRRELLVLETLLRRKGRTVLRGALEEAVYGFDDTVQPNALDTHVSRLRGKLAPAGVEIHAIRGVGYLLREAIA